MSFPLPCMVSIFSRLVRLLGSVPLTYSCSLFQPSASGSSLSVALPELPAVPLRGGAIPGAKRDIPPLGSKFHTGGQTGRQATTPLATEPYPGTLYLRFESGDQR